MTKPSDKVVKPAELKRLTDYVEVGVGERLEGERIDLQSSGVLGEDITLLDFVFIPSTKYVPEDQDKGEFLVMQYKRPGEDKVYTSTCGGGAVKDALKQMPKNYLPVIIRIKWQKSESSGRRYLMIE